MKDVLRFVMEYLRGKGADYADARFERAESESVRVRNGLIEGFSTNASSGIGIRVLYKGAWGFAASRLASEADAVRTAEEALSMAHAFSSANIRKVSLSPAAPHSDRYATPFKIDPFKVSPEEKIGLLIGVTEKAARIRRIAVAEAFMEFSRVEKEFVNTEGAGISQSILTSGGGYHVIAENNGEAQRRSYPDAHHGLFVTGGYELFDDLDMPASVERVAGEAVALLNAKECPVGETDIIVDGAQLALQIHESCGHPAELDRVLGSELSFAGGSFLTLDKKGAYRYGSRHVNLYADPAREGGAGSYRYDDEGVRSKRVDLVREGMFVDYLTSRETAVAIGQESNGSTRADGWGALPIVRMSNICIEPGEASLDELIADTKDGLLLSTNRSWSIDDLRLNFQFGTEIGYRIKNGRLGEAYKNPVYYGRTPEFWASCDSVCNRDHWRMWGLNSCGKGEPVQSANVGHGAAPARFRKVAAGVMRDE